MLPFISQFVQTNIFGHKIIFSDKVKTVMSKK